MDNCLNCFKKPESGSVLTKVEEVIDRLNAVSNSMDLDEFVRISKQLLQEKSGSGSTSESAVDGMWTSSVTSGAKFLKFINDHTEKIKDKKDIFSLGNSRVVSEILGQIGQLHWAVGGLAITAYMIQKFEKVITNKVEAFDLLSNMVDLAITVIQLKDVIEEEKMKNAVMLVVQGSIMCVSQIHSEKIFRFLKTSVNSQNLKNMSNKLHHLYRDVTLGITAINAMRLKRLSISAQRQLEVANNQLEIANRQPILIAMPKPFFPKDAVGIENALEEIIELLEMTPEDESTMVVVIYGFGGIGKTTLANAVVAKLDFMSTLDGYQYAKVNLDEDENKNNLMEMQKVILNDAFPCFQAPINLRNCEEGRHRFIEACQCAQNKPVFLFIDNVLRPEDLKKIFPQDLSDLPNRSRIFLTTRKLDATDFFLTSGILRKDFAMKPLKNEDAEEILCKGAESGEHIKDDDMGRILRICGGVPLALRIVHGHLVKMRYNTGKCSQILHALEKGSYVKEENLSQRLIEFVYNEMEDGTKDAFLDICCFFNGWIRRHVEYIVGAHEVKSLEEAALLTPFVSEKMVGIYGGEQRLKVHDIVRVKGLYMSASTRYRDVESFLEAAQDEVNLLSLLPFLSSNII